MKYFVIKLRKLFMNASDVLIDFFEACLDSLLELIEAIDEALEEWK